MANGLGIPKLQVVLSAPLHEPERLLTLRSNRDIEEEYTNRKNSAASLTSWQLHDTASHNCVKCVIPPLPRRCAQSKKMKSLRIGWWFIAKLPNVEGSPKCEADGPADWLKFSTILQLETPRRPAPKQKLGVRVGEKSFTPILFPCHLLGTLTDHAIIAFPSPMSGAS